MYTLRPVTPDDWAFWRDLHHAAERDTIVRQFGHWDEAVQDEFALVSWNDTEGERAVIVVDGIDAGWWQVKKRGDDYFLNQIILHPDFQKRGIGRALITDLIERARGERCGVTLQTLLQNTARQLYEKMGFEVSGQTETHWLMRWRN
jgi:GNAT superfamily N-acetyltransferase